VVERRDIATWLEGPGGRRNEPGSYAGQRLGLPEHGPGAVAGFGSRIVAYLIDSGACALIAYGLLRDQRFTLLVFAVEVLALTWLAGGSAGQLVRGLRVVRLDGRPIGLWPSALRTGLLLLLIPALIWDRDGRGLHDKAAGSLVVRSR
jgi:uncharacterized RDD family membrane protein YckC